MAANIQKAISPKINWDNSLKQTDGIIKNIQKAKLSAGEYFRMYRAGVDDIVAQQMRLSRSVSHDMGNGSQTMFIPPQGEIMKTASATELLNRKLSVQGEILGALGTKLQNWGKNTQWAGRQLMVGFTMPFAMAAAAAGGYSMKIDQALVRIEKVYSGSLQGFRDAAMNTAKEITNSMGQTAQSTLQVMGELAAAGKSGMELMQLTKSAQQLSTLGNVDQVESIKGVIAIQNIFKLSTQGVADAVNYLNQVEAATPTNLQDLVDAIPIAGTQIAQLGGTLQDTAILLTAFKERGIETVEGANAIKTAMNRILSPTKAAKEMFQEFTGKSLEGIVKAAGGKPLETLQALSDVITGGNIALDDQQRLITKLVGIYQSSRITGLMQGLQGKDNAVAKTKELSQQSTEEWAQRTQKNLQAITQSASGQFKIAVESAKLQMKDFGDTALKIATFVVQQVGKIFGFFNALPDPLQKIIVGLGLVVAIAGPLTMIFGLFGNLVGTAIKMGASLMKLKGGYQSMTIDQKAAELAAGNLSAARMKESEMTQILVYQLESLKAAYLETTSVANASAQMGKSGMGMIMGQPVSTKLPAGPTMPILGTNAFAADTTKALNNSSMQMTNIATQTEKASKFQKIFRTETMLGVSAVSAVASMAAESGSSFEKWTNYISLGALGLTAILPLVSKIGTGMKTLMATQFVSSVTAGIGSAAPKFIEGAKGLLGTVGKFIIGPWGLGIGAALIGIWGITKLVNQEYEEFKRKNDAILNSTDSWAQTLGRTKLEWGQIKTDAGEIKTTIEGIADKMKEKMPDVVNFIKNLTGGQLQTAVNNEALKLEGQGMNKQDIVNSLDALLIAAGKKREEIDKILSNIKVNFDFSNGAKDLDVFGKNVKDQVDYWMKYMQGGPSNGGPMGPDALKNTFLGRLAGMSDADRIVFTKQFSDQISSSFEAAFQELNAKHGNKIAKNWADARNKFFKFDSNAGVWAVKPETITNMPEGGMDTIKEMNRFITAEQQITQAIARARGASDGQVKSLSVIGDIMPFVSQKAVSASEAQDAYNKAVKQSKDNNNELTDAEKDRLAQLIASNFGLDAATLKNNGYVKATNESTGSIRENARALKVFTTAMGDVGTAADDLWSSMATTNAGFDSLGGTVQEQAAKLTQITRDIYSGTMNQVYDALAAQADQKWQARLDAITKSFEDRKNALQKQISLFDKQSNAQQQAFKDQWDATNKAVEKQSQGQIDAIDNQITAIQKEQDIEKERDDARQKQFDAEKKRIERLTALANRTLDYNKALSGGNLDEAARVMNNAESVTVGWMADDANQAAQDAASVRDKAIKKQIDQMTVTKDLIKQQKDAKLEALKIEQEAEQRALDASQTMEKERLQNKLDALGKEQQAVENSERKKQEMDKRTLDIQLATLKAFVPANETELWQHIGRVQAAYNDHGVALTVKGGEWGQIIGSALQNNVDRARMQMSQDAVWSAFGSSVANAISQGAFGMNLSEFMGLITTGALPERMSGGSSGSFNKFGSNPRGAFHAGGEVGTGKSNRLAKGNSPLSTDEGTYILQNGEYVVSKSAVQQYGADYLKMLNEGKLTFPAPEVKPNTAVGPVGVVAGMFSKGMQGMMLNAMQGMAVNAANRFPAARMALGLSGAGSQEALAWAQMQAGKPYIWGSAGPLDYDCSGFMSAITAFLEGKPLHNRLFSTGSFDLGRGVAGFVPGLTAGDFQIGVRHGSPGHMAGTLAGMNVESTGNHVRVGGDAHGATDPQFNMQFSLPDIARDPSFQSQLGPISSELPGNIKSVVQQVMAGFGWGKGAEWAALDWLVQHESSWNPMAQNPHSSAFGLFQFLDSTWGGTGIAKTSDARLQAMAGAKYIQGRYFDPIGAQTFWQGHHWYDNGGLLQPGITMAYNGTGKPENVLTYEGGNAVIAALQMANRSYQAWQKDGISATSKGDNYTYTVNIDGSNMSSKELELAVSGAIEKKHRLDMKRKGQIK